MFAVHPNGEIFQSEFDQEHSKQTYHPLCKAVAKAYKQLPSVIHLSLHVHVRAELVDRKLRRPTGKRLGADLVDYTITSVNCPNFFYRNDLPIRFCVVSGYP
jgi:hypothetical protein